MDYKCPYCPAMLKSNRAYNVHLAVSHEAYLEGEIKSESIKSLERIKDQVKFLLIKFPQARSNDKLLWEKLIQYFYPNLIVYDANEKLIMPANGKGWTFEQWLCFPSYETCRRSRQHLQEKAKKNIEGGIGKQEDADMLPSDKVAIQRELKEQAYRQYFAKSMI